MPGAPMTATRSPFSISSDVLSNSMRSWYPCVSFSMLSARCLLRHGEQHSAQMKRIDGATIRSSKLNLLEQIHLLNAIAIYNRDAST